MPKTCAAFSQAMGEVKNDGPQDDDQHLRPEMELRQRRRMLSGFPARQQAK